MSLLDQEAALERIRFHREKISRDIQSLTGTVKARDGVYAAQVGGALRAYRKDIAARRSEETAAMRSIVDYLNNHISSLTNKDLLGRAKFAKSRVLEQIKEHKK